jgi:hypothetical protein
LNISQNINLDKATAMVDFNKEHHPSGKHRSQRIVNESNEEEEEEDEDDDDEYVDEDEDEDDDDDTGHPQVQTCHTH